jgi:hypothetical protein
MSGATPHDRPPATRVTGRSAGAQQANAAEDAHMPSATRWWLASVPLAPLATIILLFSEWLFQVTKPSPLSALPLGSQLKVLLSALDVRTLNWILCAQLAASSASVVRYPRARTLALWPAAAIGGLLLLLLLDNFTYTLFGIGVTRAGAVLRVAYALALCALIFLVWWKLASGLLPRAHHTTWSIWAGAVSLLFIGAPRMLVTPPGAPAAVDVRLPVFDARARVSELPNVLFLGIDGVDAALTSAYGYERQTTPFLEAFARDALVFEHAFANASRTHGSLVTLLTGRLPFSTHVTFRPTFLQGEDADRTLPAVLKALGYTTLQVGMRHYADAEDTNVHGFDAANYRWQRIDAIGRETTARSDADLFRSIVSERISERLMRMVWGTPIADGFAHVEGRAVVPQWQDDRRVATLIEFFNSAPKPWFAHAHLLDTHCCVWRPSRMHFAGGPSKAIDGRDSQVKETDQDMRELFEALAASGQLERTIIVISSDHGAGWKATERVPLLMRFPHGEHAGRVAQTVQLADVAPTVLAYLGITPPEWMDGDSVLPGQLPPSSRPVFAVSDVQAYGGPSGARVLRDVSRNHGVAAAMVVVGPDLFELRLDTGALSGRRWRPLHSGDAVVSEEEARGLLRTVLADAGMAVAGAEPAESMPAQ